MSYVLGLVALSWQAWAILGALLFAAYLVGSIPWAYIIVRVVTGEDVTAHGTGNVGAMNVRRTTGSWVWFVVAMLADALKGFVPVLAVRLAAPYLGELASGMQGAVGAVGYFVRYYAPGATLLGAVLGHNYSIWLAIMKRKFERTGKGLATGAGGLLAYDPLYFVVVLLVGLSTIAITKYMMAGQVAAALSLPFFAIVARRPDWPYAVLAGALVYAAHHKRFVGLLKGEEPRLYVDDRMGPRG